MQRKVDLMYASVVGDDSLYSQFIKERIHCLVMIIITEGSWCVGNEAKWPSV
jgi:hypothetical protein